MDELFYFIALVAGIAGALFIWRYRTNKQRAIVRAIRKQKQKGE
ncbi:hypothetical protein [Paenibacillus alkalitolerans]|nr:hypothetical protein [Paenibacillus alkalitolerans]